MSQKLSDQSAHDFVTDLASRGLYHFTLKSFAEARGSSIAAAQGALRRLRERGEVAMPYRGFLIIVPPEYRTLSCLPADQFVPQLMAYLGKPYYVGLLSAAHYHGAAHHAPQRFQVVTDKNRRTMHCGKVAVDFIAKSNVGEIPYIERNTKRGVMRISLPEVTAFDLVGYQHHCGGLDNVATVLSELAEKINAKKLAELASLVPIPWVQRLGYLLDMVGAKTKTSGLVKFIEDRAPKVTALLPGEAVRGTAKDQIFRVAINTEVEPDL